MQFKILNNCLYLMNLYGVHPAKVGDKTQTFLFIFYLIQFSALVYLIVLLMVKEEFMPVEEKIDVTTSALIPIHVLLYLICLYVQRPKLQSLIEYMRQHFWDPESYTSPELKITYKKTMKMLQTKYYGYIFIMLVSACAVCYGPLALDRRCVPENMVFKSYIPPGINFWAMFAWQHIHSVGTINILTSMDFCICTIVSLTTLQFRLLRYEVETLFDGFEEGDRSDDSREFINKFRKCNHHYNFLISFTTMVVNTFSMLMFVYLGVIVIILCIETYLLFCIDNVVDFIRLVTYTALMYVELFLCFCYPSQELLDEANELPISLYCNTNWYKYPNYYSNILLFLGKSQRRVIFTACGLLDLDLQTGMSAIKSMLSYSAFLRSVTGLDERM